MRSPDCRRPRDCTTVTQVPRAPPPPPCSCQMLWTWRRVGLRSTTSVSSSLGQAGNGPSTQPDPSLLTTHLHPQDPCGGPSLPRILGHVEGLLFSVMLAGNGDVSNVSTQTSCPPPTHTPVRLPGPTGPLAVRVLGGVWSHGLGGSCAGVSSPACRSRPPAVLLRTWSHGGVRTTGRVEEGLRPPF